VVEGVLRHLYLRVGKRSLLLPGYIYTGSRRGSDINFLCH